MFIPIRDDNPTIRKPYLTVTLMVVNTLVFLYSVSLGSRGYDLFVIEFGFIPYELVTGKELTWQLAQSPYLTPFTSMFMHGGWMHLIGNMLFLWIFGNNIEDYLGPVKFVIFYIISGLMAIALYTLFGPQSRVPLVGASGAIAGVMGAYMVLFPRARVTVLFIFIFIQFLVLPAKLVLGIWFVYQLVMSFTGSATGGGVAWMAHVGGFVFGYALLRIITAVRGPGARGTGPSGRQRVHRVTWR